MPKVRASSGMIGTTLLPRALSRISFLSKRTNAMVVAASPQPLEVVVGKVLDHLSETGVGPEEVLADVTPGLDHVLLELTVERRVHLVYEHALSVAGEKLVPFPAPHDLDHVPPRAPEQRLELLNDLAVAAHGTIESLEVAVDDEDEVVEALARRDLQSGHRLGLVHLPVTDERPHALLGRVLDSPVL